MDDSAEVAPSKPTEPGFDGFVGWLPAESTVVRTFGCQSIHRFRFAWLDVGLLIATPADLLRIDSTVARRTALT